MLGVCQCNDGFGGGDCSVDINEPPPVYAVNYETGGLCDKLFCKEAIVDGDLFLDRSGLTCKMQRFAVLLLYFFNIRGGGGPWIRVQSFFIILKKKYTHVT